jgi:hypothetical protein
MRHRVVDIDRVRHRKARQEFADAYRELRDKKRWVESKKHWTGPAMTVVIEAMIADMRSASARVDQALQELHTAWLKSLGPARQT